MEVPRDGAHQVLTWSICPALKPSPGPCNLYQTGGMTAHLLHLQSQVLPCIRYRSYRLSPQL